MSETVLTSDDVKMLREVVAGHQAGAGSWWPKWGPTIITIITLSLGALSFGANVDKRMALAEQAQARMQDDIRELTATVKVLVTQTNAR